MNFSKNSMDALSKLKALQGHAFGGEAGRMQKDPAHVVSQKHEILPSDFGVTRGSTVVEPPVPTLFLEKAKEKRGKRGKVGFHQSSNEMMLETSRVQVTMTQEAGECDSLPSLTNSVASLSTRSVVYRNNDSQTPKVTPQTTKIMESAVSAGIPTTGLTLEPTALPLATDGIAPTPYKASVGTPYGYDINISIASNYKQILDIKDDMIHTVLKKIKNQFVDLDVRKVQATVFINSVNSQVNDYHKAAFGPDLISSWPHYLWIALWGILIGTIVTLLIVLGGMKIAFQVMTILFYIFISLEYILMFVAMKLGQYAPLPKLNEEDSANDQITPGKIALIIPLGWGIKGLTQEQKVRKRAGKLEVLTNTLQGALNVFHPTDVFVVHNSSDQELPDSVVMECCEGRAVYVPLAIGSKSCSAYYGSILSSWLGFEYCIVMDDDTVLPRELAPVLSGELTCDAYAIAIAATYNETGPGGQPTNLSKTSKMIVGLQDIEYKLSDLSKLTQYNFTHSSSVLSPHGAINLWKASLLHHIMAEHNGIFHGEDYQMGLAMRKLFSSKRCGFISSCIVATVAPTTWKDLYYQRFTSWDLAAQQFLWGGFCASPKSGFYGQVLCCLPCTVDNLYLRIVTLEDIWTVLQDYFRYPLLIYHIVLSIIIRQFNVVVFLMYILVFVAQWIIAASLEYIKFKDRPDLQVRKESRLVAVLMFPVYRFLFSFVRVNALFRFFFKFESIKRAAISIKEMNLPVPKRIPLLYPGLEKASTDGVEIVGSAVIRNRKGVDEGLVREILQIALKEQKTPRSREFLEAVQSKGGGIGTAASIRSGRLSKTATNEFHSKQTSRLNLTRQIGGPQQDGSYTPSCARSAVEYIKRFPARTPLSAQHSIVQSNHTSSRLQSALVEAGEPTERWW